MPSRPRTKPATLPLAEATYQQPQPADDPVTCKAILSVQDTGGNAIPRLVIDYHNSLGEHLRAYVPLSWHDAVEGP